MPICRKQTTQYDFKKEAEEAKNLKSDTVEDESVQTEIGTSVDNREAELPPCVQEIIEYDSLKQVLAKWRTLKRARQMYEEQVTNKRTECFRAEILKQMKTRIAEMPYEERKSWLTKLVRLAFLEKLKEIKEVKKTRTRHLLRRLEESDGDTRDRILDKLAELKNLYDMRELDDVHEIMDLKKAKKEFKMKKAKRAEMKIRLKRLQKVEEVRKKEEKMLRQERVEKLKEVITVRKNWQEEVVKHIDDVTRTLAEQLVRLDDRKAWYDRIHAQVEQERETLMADERQRRMDQERVEMIRREKDMIALKREQKLKEIETWRKERKIRLWKLDKVKKFQEFLESRYLLAEADENLFFRKIFDKLTVSQQKGVEVDPWDVKPKMGDRQQEIAMRKKINNWIQGVVSSTKQKVVNKVKLKKYLEAVECPRLDQLVSHTRRIATVNNIMVVIRGRILRNTFPDKSKNFIAKELNRITAKTKMDIRDIDPTDKLLGVQLTTIQHDLFMAVGDEYLVVVEQVMPKPEEPCQQKTDVLCLTIEERDKILELIKKRQQSRKVIKDTRLAEYEAFQNRKALDDAWMKYMQKACLEAVKDLTPCRRGDEDVVRIEVQPDRRQPSAIYEADGEGWCLGKVGLTEEQIQALVAGCATSMVKKEKTKMDYNKAMDSRVNRLVKSVLSQGTEPSSKLYYLRQQAQMKEILEKEKTVRNHMIKDLPQEIEDF